MIGMTIWSILLLLVAMGWLLRHRAISEGVRRMSVLSEGTFVGPPTETPLVSVLIAAKDEEANIATAVRTMLEQDYPNFELIVINDRSTDRTGEILEAIRAERGDDRLKVVHVRELREGWFGKNNAMREGVTLARGDWLCFGDADCRQKSRKTLSTAVRFALAEKIDFLSLLPELEMNSLWERIIQPVCSAVMILWFMPEKVNNPASPEAYANGAFMLMSRSCHEAIGGYEAVRTEVNEDMHMARLAKERGQRLFVIQNDGLYSVRMYTTFKQIWLGWSRIFFGCFGTFRRLRLTFMMLTIMNVFPYLSLMIAALELGFRGWAAAGGGWQAVAAAAALVVVFQQSVIMRFYRVSGADWRLAPTFIIGALICIGMLISAMLKLGGRSATVWRGTTYRADKVV
ncbi:MAG TPA: glycosyltransferase [Phycisphaerae bacterium]|nr:glycosyltransferase [Phycisphaerae bacterium]